MPRAPGVRGPPETLMRIKAPWTVLALIAACLMAVASAAGLFVDSTYALETPEWAAQGIGQDLINVAIVFPVLVISAVLARRGSVRARLIAIGALFYVAYSYALYSLFVHFGTLFLAYVAVLGLSVYALIGATAELDTDALQGVLGARHWRRAAAVFLVVVGGIFALLWLAEIVPATLAGVTPESVEASTFAVNPIHVLDLALCLPAVVVTGVLLWKDRPRGLLFAVPFTTFLSLMGTAIVAMVVVMWWRGIPVSMPMLAVMVTIAMAADLMTILLLGGAGARSERAPAA
jgi:hypothetical protein